MDLAPDWLWLRLIRLRWACLASRKPADALRLLLKADSDLNGYIDQAAVHYDRGLHVKHRLTGYHDFFVERIHAGEKVLDAGCGNGAVAFDVAELTGASVVGMDLDPENIAKAQQMFPHPRAAFIVGDVLKGIPDGGFDVVILSNVLEHLPGRPQFLKDLLRVSTAERILIRVPLFERDWRVPLREELGLEWRSDSTHETEYTVESFAKEMDSAGLEVTHQEIRWGEIWAEAISRRPRES